MKYKPDVLEEFAALEYENGVIDPEIRELWEVVLIETKEALLAVRDEIGHMDPLVFSLDSFYEFKRTISSYREVLNEIDPSLWVNNLDIELGNLEELLEQKNPIFSVTKKSEGLVLIHSSDLKSLNNLMHTPRDQAEVCASGGSLLKYHDVFRPKKRLDAGLIYNAQDAFAYFSKDVGSHTVDGRRVVEKRFEKYKYSNLQDAIKQQVGKRIEAWVDAVQVRPVAVLIIDNSIREDVIAWAHLHSLPVVYSSGLYS